MIYDIKDYDELDLAHEKGKSVMLEKAGCIILILGESILASAIYTFLCINEKNDVESKINIVEIIVLGIFIASVGVILLILDKCLN